MKSFLSKKQVKQIIKLSWGNGKFSDWEFDYMGKDVIYMSCNNVAILEFRPSRTSGIMFLQKYFIVDGLLIQDDDYKHLQQYVVFYRLYDQYHYSGVAHGNVYDSRAYLDAKQQVKTIQHKR